MNRKFDFVFLDISFNGWSRWQRGGRQQQLDVANNEATWWTMAGQGVEQRWVIEGGNEVLDEREEEDEDGGAFVLKEEDEVDSGAKEGGLGILRSGSRRWEIELVEVKWEALQQSQLCIVFRELGTYWYQSCWR